MTGRNLIRIGWPVLHIIVAVALTVLAASGVFLSMFKVPLYVGAPWAVIALVTFFFRPFRSKVPAALLITGIAFSLAAPVVQSIMRKADLERRETAAMNALSEIRVPQLAFSHLMNTDSATIPEEGVVVLNFWATWCPPCLEEMPMLEEFAAARAGSVTVIGLTSLDGNPDAALRAIRDYVSDQGVTFPIVIADDWTNHAAYQVRTIPATLLIDDGRIIDYAIGIEGTKRVLRSADQRAGGSDRPS